jgi:signal recognition particle receptor subunit beta
VIVFAMEGVLSQIGELLPPAAKQALQPLAAQLASSAESLPKDLQLILSTPEGLVLLFVSLLAGVALLALLVRPSSGSKRNTILLVGPSNAGKTALFYQLTDGEQHHGTVASMQENAATASIPAKGGGSRSMRLVDVPGHSSMRHKLESLLHEAAGVVFLVDSVEVTPHRTEAADLLYDVLTHPELQRRRLPLLIACNKMDLEAEAHSKVGGGHGVLGAGRGRVHTAPPRRPRAQCIGTGVAASRHTCCRCSRGVVRHGALAQPPLTQPLGAWLRLVAAAAAPHAHQGAPPPWHAHCWAALGGVRRARLPSSAWLMLVALPPWCCTGVHTQDVGEAAGHDAQDADCGHRQGGGCAGARTGGSRQALLLCQPKEPHRAGGGLLQGGAVGRRHGVHGQLLGWRAAAGCWGGRAGGGGAGHQTGSSCNQPPPCLHRQHTLFANNKWAAAEDLKPSSR